MDSLIDRFWNNRLSDHQFNTICNISLSSNLRQLSIDNNPSVSDILWATLCGEESYVKNISLRGNCITDVGAKALAHALKTNRMLVSLNLFDNKIQKSGAEALGEV
jgi:Ran GTPase-activating protein (RanGAP) involved in mRNA processing and transport